MPKKKPIRKTIQTRSHVTDAMGQGISPESLRKAITAWNELWKSGKFDCGPQDYDCMAKEILHNMGVTSEVTQQSGVIECPNCGRDTFDSRAALFDSLYVGLSRCQHCKREFRIEDGIPKRK